MPAHMLVLVPVQGTVEERGLSLWVKTSQGAQDGLAFVGERATKVIPYFLCKAKVGQMVTIPPRYQGKGREEEGERDEVGEEEGKPETPNGH